MTDESLLSVPDICFRAQRNKRGRWDLVVGDRDVGYEKADDLRSWREVEKFCWGAIGRLYES